MLFNAKTEEDSAKIELTGGARTPDNAIFCVESAPEFSKLLHVRERINKYSRGKLFIKGQKQACVIAYHPDLA